jgi:hypothetical protein
MKKNLLLFTFFRVVVLKLLQQQPRDIHIECSKQGQCLEYLVYITLTAASVVVGK